MVTVTLSGEGWEEKGTRIHIHWRVNIQADGVGWGGSASLPHKLGINLGHKTEISILGSKQRLVCKVSMRAWLAREGPPADRRECLLSQWAHRPAPAKESSRGETRGRHQLKGEGRGIPNGRGLPRGRLPRGRPHPHLAIAPFTVCALGCATRSQRKDGVTSAVQVPQCSRRLDVAESSGATRTRNRVTCL